MSEAFESIMRGLREALAFSRGEETGAVVHYFDEHGRRLSQIEVERANAAAKKDDQR